MKSIFLLLLLGLCSNLFAQNSPILLKYFVKRDTVQLRWAPTTAELLLDGLKSGYTIERYGSSEEQIQIAPFLDRKSDLLMNADSFELNIIELVEDFVNESNTENLSMSFSLFTLGSSAYKSMSKILGVYYEDLNLPKSKFSYQVYINKSEIKSNEIQLNSNKQSKNKECTELTGESRLDLKEAYLKWEAKSMNDSYGGYWILKSTDKKKFQKLNETPLFHFVSKDEPDKIIIDYIDTAVVEGETYYYKIQPINHFGDPGVQSNTAEVYIQQRLNGFCFIDSVTANEFDRHITGFYKGTDKEKLNKFILMRSDKIDSVYVTIDEQEARGEDFYFDYQANKLSGDRHYFKVIAVSIDGDSAVSYPYYHFSLDQEPPGLPTNLKGKIDSLGIVSLSWNAPFDNDIRGFRVYRSNSLKEEFVEITKNFALNNKFSDTLSLNTLTNEVFYKVRTVDNNYNNGQLTNPLELLKPDTIAPIPGVIRKYKVSKEGIYLSWSNSASTDLKMQYVVRGHKTGRDTILAFLDEVDTLLDISGQVGQNYAYYLVAEDFSGNTASSQALNLKYEIGYRPAPLFTKVEVRRDDKLIRLEWNSIDENVYAIYIYRAKGDGKFKVLKTIRDNVNSFEDKDLYYNNEYHYRIQVAYQSGLSSKMSVKRSVMY